MPETAAEIGQYRPAHRVREGWQIRFITNGETDSTEWLTVTGILRVYAPVNFVRFTFNDESASSVAHDTDVFCRTAAEVRKAEAS
ncbi:hypothetical protein [Streptomyces sp. NPDC001492]